MQTRMLLLGGAICAALLMAAQLTAQEWRMDDVGSRVPGTLDTAALWNVHGGANFQCCQYLTDCYDDPQGCSDYDPIEDLGDALWCRTHFHIDPVGGNDYACAASENEEDECTAATVMDTCLQRRRCRVISIAEESHCVLDWDLDWEVVATGPDWCTGPECDM